VTTGVQLPERHAEPVGHLIPQPPQLLRSNEVAVHWPEQSVVPLGQPQPPPVHCLPPVHAMKQPPQ
jgi:hypothetical protein